MMMMMKVTVWMKRCAVVGCGTAAARRRRLSEASCWWTTKTSATRSNWSTSSRRHRYPPSTTASTGRRGTGRSTSLLRRRPQRCTRRPTFATLSTPPTFNHAGVHASSSPDLDGLNCDRQPGWSLEFHLKWYLEFWPCPRFLFDLAFMLVSTWPSRRMVVTL